MPVTMQQLANGTTQVRCSLRRHEMNFVISSTHRYHAIPANKQNSLTYILLHLQKRYALHQSAVPTNHRIALNTFQQFFQTPEKKSSGCCSTDDIRYEFVQCSCRHLPNHHSNLYCRDFAAFCFSSRISPIPSLYHVLKNLCDHSSVHPKITQSAKIVSNYINSIIQAAYPSLQSSAPSTSPPMRVQFTTPSRPLAETPMLAPPQISSSPLGSRGVGDFTNLGTMISDGDASLMPLSEFKQFLLQPLQKFNAALATACQSGQMPQNVPLIMGINLQLGPNEVDPINYVYSCLHEFIYDFQRQGYDRTNWTGTIRDFHRRYINHHNRTFAFDAATGSGSRSFLIFTRANQQNKFFILIKPNTFLKNEVHHVYKGRLWEAGSRKQVKLFGLLLTCDWNDRNLISLESVKRVVTFTNPTLQTLGTLRRLYSQPQADTVRRDALAANPSKATIMDTLLHTPPAEFDFGYETWDIISYTDSRTLSHQQQIHQKSDNHQRILAYQEFQGALITLEHLKNLAFDQKTYAALAFLNHLKDIIHSKKTWARDIKINNTVISQSLDEGKTYPVFIPIDWSGCTCTFSDQIPLKNPPTFPSSDTYTFLDWKRDVYRLESDGEINPHNFQKIIAQFCFEILHMLYFIYNHDLHCSNDVVSAFMMREEYKGKINRVEFERLVQSVYTDKNIQELPFHQLLMRQVYDEDQIERMHPNSLAEFFKRMRDELSRISSIDLAVAERNASAIPMLGADDLHSLKFDHPNITHEFIQSALNDIWIQEFVEGFTDLPAYRRTHPLFEPKIEELLSL